jgi:hypothetical protein
MIVNGTERNIPTGPNIHPQKIIERKTKSVEMPTPLDNSLGSSRFPTRLFTTRYPIAMKAVSIKVN